MIRIIGPRSSIPLLFNNADKARLDVAAIGLWSTFEKTIVDVRILNPNSESYKFQTLAKLYGQHENQKKRHYLNRILQVEKGTFSPLVFQQLVEWVWRLQGF